MLDYLSLIAGAIIGFIGSVGLYFIEEKRHLQKASLLLETEIFLLLENIDGILPSLKKIKRDPTASVSDIPTPKLDTLFYENSVEYLSLFNKNKIKNIKTFYFFINVYQHDIEKAIGNEGDKTLVNGWIEEAIKTLTYAKEFGTLIVGDLNTDSNLKNESS